MLEIPETTAISEQVASFLSGRTIVKEATSAARSTTALYANPWQKIDGNLPAALFFRIFVST